MGFITFMMLGALLIASNAPGSAQEPGGNDTAIPKSEPSIVNSGQKIASVFQIALVTVFGMTFVSSFIALLIMWCFFHTVLINMWRTVNSLNEKLILTEKVMARRKFADEVIGQLSHLANFDVKCIDDDGTGMLKTQKMDVV